MNLKTLPQDKIRGFLLVIEVEAEWKHFLFTDAKLGRCEPNM